MGFISQGVTMRYEKEVKTALGFYSKDSSEILTEKDIVNLPESVQKYIRYAGALGKPKIWNFRVEMGGKLRNDDKSGWMEIKTVQYNFIESPVRMFYIKGSMFGIPVYGLHAYKSEEGIMLIKVMGLFPVVDVKGTEMNISDTVTIFNDMCVFAPASLIDKRIAWETVDQNTVKATFTNGSNKVTAMLYFNERGELVNFVSDDRYRIDKKAERLRWSTPIYSYKNYNGLNLSAKASALWHYPDREFSYADFDIQNVEYNVSEFK